MEDDINTLTSLRSVAAAAPSASAPSSFGVFGRVFYKIQ